MLAIGVPVTAEGLLAEGRFEPREVKLGMRQPAVSATQIAFVYAGDIWLADKSGGVAVRLSSPKGEESFPRFSPDGTLLAFSGDYDGNEDIYLMPVTGGLPRRLVPSSPLSFRQRPSWLPPVPPHASAPTASWWQPRLRPCQLR